MGYFMIVLLTMDLDITIRYMPKWRSHEGMYRELLQATDQSPLV